MQIQARFNFFFGENNQQPYILASRTHLASPSAPSSPAPFPTSHLPTMPPNPTQPKPHIPESPTPVPSYSSRQGTWIRSFKHGGCGFKFASVWTRTCTCERAQKWISARGDRGMWNLDAHQFEKVTDTGYPQLARRRRQARRHRRLGSSQSTPHEPGLALIPPKNCFRVWPRRLSQAPLIKLESQVNKAAQMESSGTQIWCSRNTASILHDKKVT